MDRRDKERNQFILCFWLFRCERTVSPPLLRITLIEKEAEITGSVNAALT